MSGSANLGINITARDTASAEIKGLQTQVQGLTQALRQLSQLGANANATSAAGFAREAEAIKKEIGALNELIAAKIRGSAAGIRADQQEAEYINRNIDLIKAQQRALADYVNQQEIASQRQMRQLAEYENAQRNAAAKSYRKSPFGIIEAASPASASGAAAAKAAMAGASAEEIETAAIEAGILARERQVMAIKAVDEAMRAAARAGANEAEIEVAGAKAATAAINAKAVTQERANAVSAGGGGSGVSSMLSRESRHVVGLFDSLARGQRGQAISSIGAAARDAGFGVGALGASMGALVAIMGAHALISGAENMGRWATQTRAAASAVGMSIGSYSQLQGALTLTGLKAEEADTTLKHLAESLATAIANPASKAAEAFRNLGISQDALGKTGGDANEVLKLLADAFVKTADGANKTANMNEIAGRGFEKLIPLLQNGSQGLAEMTEKAKGLSIATEEEAKELEKTGEQATSLGTAIKSSAIKSFEEWQPVIRVTIGLLKELVSEIGLVVGGFGMMASGVLKLAQGALSSPFESYPDHVKRMMALTHPAAPGGGGGAMDRHDTAAGKVPVPALQEPVGPLAAMREKMAEAQMNVAEGVTGKGAAIKRKMMEDEAKAEIKIMQDTLANEKLTNTERVALRTELANKITGLDNRMASPVGGGNKHQETTDYIADIKLRIAEAEGNSAKISSLYDEEIAKLRELAAAHKATAAQISNAEREKVQAVNKARLDEIKEGARTTEQQNRLSGLDTQLGQMARGQYNFGGSAQTQNQLKTQSTQALAEAQLVKQAADAEIAALTQVRDTAAEGSTTQKQASAEIMNVLLQSKSQEIELYKKAGEAAQQAADKAAEGFKKFFDSVGQGFETFTSSVLKSLIAPQQEIIKKGLTSVTQNLRGSEIQQAFGSLATHMLSSLGNSIQEAIGSTIAKALSGGAADTIGQLLSQTFSKVLGNITGGAIGNAAGNAVGGAAGNAAVSAAITASATATTTGISTAITAAAATQTAAVTAGSASVVAAITASAAVQEALLAANAVKPSVLGFSYAGGGVVPSAAGGMVLGDSRGGQLAILHPREMVLPASLSQGIQGMIAGQGRPNAGVSNNANLNFSPTINTGSRSRSGTGMTRAEFGQMMSTHSGAMLGEARNMMRSGWRPT